MNDIFSNLLDVDVSCYIDDILVYSDDPAEHKKHVHEVLHCLHQHGLYAHPDKCCFSVDSIKYLGFILSKDVLKMDPAKIDTIKDWPEPWKVKNVQSFLGFTNFYRRFISDYSDIVVLLTWLTHKGMLWNFTDAAQKSFEAFKMAFTRAPILTHWILNCPVAFHSCTFSSPELNYDIHDKELLAIFKAFCVWQHYLEGAGTPSDIVTDHKNLAYFSTTKVLTH